MNKQAISHRYQLFREALPQAGIFYAVKANASRQIIKLLNSEGCGFEISSAQELKLVLDCGVSPNQIISSNPLKSISFIEKACQARVKYFAFDSEEEIDKLARYAPYSNVYVRLSVPNDESEWPLDRKFGVESEQAAKLLLEAKKHNLVPIGITFHVGSQCASKNAWIAAIKKCAQVRQIVAREGLEIKMLNIGGGFPIQHSGSVPSISEISQTIRSVLDQDFPDNPQISVEPGRALVGDAGTMVSSVIAKATRNGERWLYLDVGVFNGLMETMGGIQYSMTADKDEALHKWAVAGPSCDGMDCISNEVYLPELEIGDKVYIWPAGAYTTAYASQFNGISIPRIYFV